MAESKTVKTIQLVEDWQQAWKFLSVQLASAMVILQVLEENFPQIQQYLPEGWVKYVGLAIVVGRILRQNNIVPIEPKADTTQQ
jgi:PIN domain nuclease of toxin-antitoxin system